MKTLPLISVIVPVYNTEIKYLQNCFESLIKQTYKNLEIIIIDDGSTNETKDFCDIYAEKLNATVIHQLNQGYALSRNSGLKIAKGDFIYFIDSDDCIHPQTIEILYKLISEDDYDFSMISFKQTFTSNIPDFQIDLSKEKRNILKKYDLIQGLFNENPNFYEILFQILWNKLYRKSILENEFLIKTGTEDTEFNHRIYNKTNKAIFVNLPLYIWVQRNSSVTHTAINLNYIDRMNSYLITYKNTSSSDILSRAYCLIKLYKTMMNIRYYGKNTEYKSFIKNNIQKIKKETLTDFISNKKINIIKKLGILIFLYCPFTYDFFMFLCNMKAKYHL